MNGTLESAEILVQALNQGISEAPDLIENFEFAVCPPFLHLSCVQKDLGDHIKLGAQDCAFQDNGAFTGAVSAGMLKDAGCEYVILGHSERRQIFGEADQDIALKTKKALETDLIPILCVGETLEERERNEQEGIVSKQLEIVFSDIVFDENQTMLIAYEPVWAIGTGKSASVFDIEDMHGFIHQKLLKITGKTLPILYGGSVTPENAKDILHAENVSGALVGGASLKAESFLGIAREAQKG